jgi:alpha-L-fucosidase
MLRRALAAVLLPLALSAQDVVLVPPGADADAIAALAATVRPSARQLAWQQLGFTAFVHFGMNTFTNREWGEGNEDPKQFAPTDFDAEQWVKTFADAGMRGLILTCKHHDGFCLWPSQSTQHTVAQSPWRDGKGDVVREVAAACRKHGLAFGVYLSPWDRNSKVFGTPAYMQVFEQQLRELCSNYGPLFEVWFDGANCPADDPALFAWQRFFRLVRELQPNAVLAITGPDVRWVGNEGGKTRPEEWSVLPLDTNDRGDLETSRAAWQSLWRLRNRAQEADLGSRSALVHAQRLMWQPAETDVSIRPGWFWHPAEDTQVKPLTTLLDYWFGAVGGNAQLLLNVPADTHGQIAAPDVAVLRDLGSYLSAMVARDLGADAARKTYALAGELYLPEPRTISVIELAEDVEHAGQCVEAFRIDTWDGQQWQEFARGTTIGMRRLLRVPPTTVQGVRYWIEQSRGKPKIRTFALYRAPDLLAAPTIRRDRSGKVSIEAEGAIHFTTDGSLPTAQSPIYDRPFDLPRGGLVRAIALRRPQKGNQSVGIPRIGEAMFGIPTATWTVLQVSSEQGPAEGADKAFDGDPSSLWHSRYSPDMPKPPHFLAIDLGVTIDLAGFIYQPRQSGNNGTIADYALEVRGTDGGPWREVAAGTFAAKGGKSCRVMLREPAQGVRAVRLIAKRECDGRPFASCAELQLLAR